MASERLKNYVRTLRLHSKEGSLSYHTCYDMGLHFTLFSRSHPKVRPVYEWTWRIENKIYILGAHYDKVSRTNNIGLLHL